jgi:CRISPR-associated protein Csm5
MSKMTPYKVRLHVISPVHIGCDDVYEPTGFMVDKAAQKLIAFDPLDFIRSLSQADRKKFLELCDKGTLASIVELYKFMSIVAAPPGGHAVQASPGLISTYERVTKMNPRDERQIKQELNNLLISRTSYLPADNAPYIPGSALKGALRTGWLNHLNKGRQMQGRDIEVQLLGGRFAEDPFSQIKVSDLLPLDSPATRICFAVNKKKKTSQHEPRGPQQILEVIRHDCSAVFEGIITLHVPEQGTPIKSPIKNSPEFFAQSTGFFSTEMAAEEVTLKSISLPASIAVKMKAAFGDKYLKTVFPIRIGRHSGAECVTVAGARSIKIMGKKGDQPKYGPNATTLWLAGDAPKADSNLLPFGWVALELLELDHTAPLWPERTVAVRETAAGAVPAAAVKAPPPPPPEQIVWDTALLVWNPGNQTLTAQFDGKKADIKLAADKSIVPETLHKKLFVKKDTAKAAVTVEKNGNAYQVVKIAQPL